MMCYEKSDMKTSFISKRIYTHDEVKLISKLMPQAANESSSLHNEHRTKIVGLEMLNDGMGGSIGQTMCSCASWNVS